MANIMAPSEADSVSFDPHRDKQALAGVIADAEIALRQGGHNGHRGPAERGPLMAETPFLVLPYQTAILALGKPQISGTFFGHSARSRVG